MKFNRILFSLVMVFVSVHQSLFSMENPCSSIRQLKTAMKRCENALNQSLNPNEPVGCTAITAAATNASGTIENLRKAMQSELIRRRDLREGHTVAPLINAIFAHSRASLLPIEGQINAAYDKDLDGIPDQGFVLALGAHAESAVILERLFGIVNNQPAAFKSSGQAMANLLSLTSVSKKWSLLKAMTAHYRQWFNHNQGRTVATATSSNNSVEAKITARPLTKESTTSGSSGIKKRKDKEKEESDDEDVCSTKPSTKSSSPTICTTTTSITEPSQVQSPELCANQLERAAYYRAYLHDLYMQLLIELGDVNLLLDGLAYCLPLDEDGITQLAPQYARIDAVLKTVSTHGNHLVQICHDGYMTTLPKTINPQLYKVKNQLRKNSRMIRDVARLLTPDLAKGVQTGLWGGSVLGSVTNACETTTKKTGSIFGFLGNAISYVAPSNESTEEIEEREEEQLATAENNERALIVAPPFSRTKKVVDEKSDAAETTDMLRLFSDIRSLLEDLSPVVEACATGLKEVRLYTQECTDKATIPTYLKKAEQHIASLVGLCEQLRCLITRRHTRTESFGSPEFRAWMEHAAAEWRQPSEFQEHQSGPENGERLTDSNIDRATN